MPYDLELPSGKVVTGVPDNYKKDELLTILRTKLPDEFLIQMKPQEEAY